MRRFLTLALLSASVAFGSGCTTMAKRTFKEFKGSSSDAEAVPGTGGGNFSRFASVTVAPPRTDNGGLVNSKFTSSLSNQLRKYLSEDKDAPFKGGGSPALQIEPEIVYFNKGGSLFPEKVAVVLYWFKAEGGDYGRVQVATKSEASGTGDDDLAESNAKELAKYFEKHGKKAK